ncbi:MAG: hypothetical protein FWC47_16470 [Oscillospiraceae bacterium]|nr:hypothetical protein [Oscillospiraceae bacterium]
MRYDTKKVKNRNTLYGRKRMWQAIIIGLISLVTIVLFFYLPWIIISENLKINAVQFCVSLNGIIDYSSALESTLSNASFLGININDSINAMKLFRTTIYVAFAIPAVNVILILLAIFLKKMRTLLRFVVFICMTCVVISIAEIILLNNLQFDYKYMLILVYNNFHTDTFHIAFSVQGFNNTILMTMLQNYVTKMDNMDAILSSSSFMTLVLSIWNILISWLFYAISRIRRANREIEKSEVVGDNI